MADKEKDGNEEEAAPPETLADLLRQYRDDTMKTITALETKLKDTGLLENETYQLLKRTYEAHMDAMATTPLAFVTAVPAYYSFGYFIYGFLEGRGFSIKKLMGEEAFKQWQDTVDGKGSLQQWTDKIHQIEMDATRWISGTIRRHFDPISPPDPNNPPDPNEPRAR